MSNQLEVTKDIEFFYDFILRGYDVVMTPSDKGDDYIFVNLALNGRPLYEIDICLSSERDDPLKFEEESEYAANAAIDFYEAEHEVLGQGAGSETIKKNKPKGKESMKKLSFYPVECHEDWLMSFKDTPFEDDAFILVERLIDYEHKFFNEDDFMKGLNDRKDNIINQANKLDLQRLRMSPKKDVEVIVKINRKRSFGDGGLDIEKYLSKFDGCELEAEALQLMQELISVTKQINEFNSKETYYSDDYGLIMKEMDDLLFKKIEWENFDMFNMVEMSPIEQELSSLLKGIEVDPSLFGVEQPPMDTVDSGLNSADPFEYYRSSKHKKAPELTDRSEYSLEVGEEEDEEAFKEHKIVYK
jgi:hypothetical protein